MSFGKHLMEARRKAGLSRTELAYMIDMKECSVTGWEQDRVEPKFFNLCRASKILGVPMNEMASWVSEEDL